MNTNSHRKQIQTTIWLSFKQWDNEDTTKSRPSFFRWFSLLTPHEPHHPFPKISTKSRTIYNHLQPSHAIWLLHKHAPHSWGIPQITFPTPHNLQPSNPLELCVSTTRISQPSHTHPSRARTCALSLSTRHRFKHACSHSFVTHSPNTHHMFTQTHTCPHAKWHWISEKISEVLA
jgi:hypothetical protein